MRSIWDSFSYLETEPTARAFLTKTYASTGLERPERHAFQQSNRFLYTWKQARAFYHAAAANDLLIRPLLLFYGCVHLLKGVLISRDPFYPQNSRMLQHGVTTRKIKKNPYHLLEDEIRPQKEGLFPYLVQVLRHPILQDRYRVDQLFSYLPELAEDYRLITDDGHWQLVTLSTEDATLSFAADSAGTLAYSDETFIQYLNRLAPSNLRFSSKPNAGSTPSPVRKKLILELLDNEAALEQHPLFAKKASNTYLFWSDSMENLPLPSWCTHYLLLYLLGMLCRYETEWWGELVLSHAFAETYLVHRFLAVHEKVFPAIILDLLEKQNTRL
jgi:hypothetical protein